MIGKLTFEAIRAAVFAAPLAWKLGAVALGVTFIGGAYFVHRHNIYTQGYNDAISDVAKKNSAAADDVRKSVSAVRACRDAGGAWNQSRGVCE